MFNKSCLWYRKRPLCQLCHNHNHNHNHNRPVLNVCDNLLHLGMSSKRCHPSNPHQVSFNNYCHFFNPFTRVDKTLQFLLESWHLFCCCSIHFNIRVKGDAIATHFKQGLLFNIITFLSAADLEAGIGLVKSKL